MQSPFLHINKPLVSDWVPASCARKSGFWDAVWILCRLNLESLSLGTAAAPGPDSDCKLKSPGIILFSWTPQESWNTFLANEGLIQIIKKEKFLSVLLLIFWLLFFYTWVSFFTWNSTLWGPVWAWAVNCTVTLHSSMDVRMNSWQTSPHVNVSCTEKQESSCKNSLLKAYTHSITHLKGTVDPEMTI